MKKGLFISTGFFNPILNFFNLAHSSVRKKFKLDLKISHKIKILVLIFMTMKNPDSSINRYSAILSWSAVHHRINLNHFSLD